MDRFFIVLLLCIAGCKKEKTAEPVKCPPLIDVQLNSPHLERDRLEFVLAFSGLDSGLVLAYQADLSVWDSLESTYCLYARYYKEDIKLLEDSRDAYFLLKNEHQHELKPGASVQLNINIFCSSEPGEVRTYSKIYVILPEQ